MIKYPNDTMSKAFVKASLFNMFRDFMTQPSFQSVESFYVYQ